MLAVSLVRTDMGSRSAQFTELERALVAVEDRVRGITNQV